MQQLKIVHRRRGPNKPKYVMFDVLDLDEDCAIMHEPVREVDLGFMQPWWFSDHRNRRGMRLACGHVFAVSSILYHWVRNDTVLCPVCRQGHKDARVNIRTVPLHLRRDLQAKLRLERSRHQSAASSVVVAMQISQTVCDVMFQSYEGNVLLVRCITNSHIVHITDISILHSFLANTTQYRVWCFIDGCEMPASPWARVDQAWTWAGPAGYSVSLTDGRIGAVVIVF